MRARVVKTKQCRAYGVLPPEAELPEHDQYWALRAEPVPPDDADAAAACEAAGAAPAYAHVTHAQFQEASHDVEDYGEPLVLVVAPDDTLGALKRRCAPQKLFCSGFSRPCCDRGQTQICIAYLHIVPTASHALR